MISNASVTANCSNIRRIDSNPRFSRAVVYEQTVYLAGHVPLDSAGATIDVQTREVLRRIEDSLHDSGSHRGLILQASVFLSDAAHIEGFNAAWSLWIPADQAPARTLVISPLVHPGWQVEVAVVAALAR